MHRGVVRRSLGSNTSSSRGFGQAFLAAGSDDGRSHFVARDGAWHMNFHIADTRHRFAFVGKCLNVQLERRAAFDACHNGNAVLLLINLLTCSILPSMRGPCPAARIIGRVPPI